MAKIYIAGPMTGYKDWNFPAFFDTEYQLKALGHEVVNPAHNDGETVEAALESAGDPKNPNNPWSYYMRRDLPHVLGVDLVCVLPGWQNSRGAKLEVQVARAVGIPLVILRDGKLLPRVEVIGLSGYARSGKDTVAECMENNFGYKKMSFAAPIKEALAALNPSVTYGYDSIPLDLALQMFNWEDLKTETPEVRGLLQRLGTEVGREMFGENFWVDAAIDRIEDGSKVVFADCRFPNEADAIRALGGQVWRIERLGVGPANSHISEHALEGYEFDEKIMNAGTVEDLCSVVDGLLTLYP